MAKILDIPNCTSVETQFNTGVPLCDLVKKKLLGVIYTDPGKVFTGADIASTAAFIAAVKAATTAPRGERVYPIWNIYNFEDSTGDPATGGFGNLTTANFIVSDPIPVFRFGYDSGELRHKRIAEMAAMKLRVLLVDEQFAVYGTDVDGNLAGFNTSQNYAYPSKFIIADAVNQYSFRTTLASINEYTRSSKFIVANSGLLSAVGLVTAFLTFVSNVDNVVTLDVLADGGTNLVDLYPEIATLTFTAKNLQTGDAIPVTSVTEAGGHLVVTLDAAAWGALEIGDDVQIYGPTTQALATAGIKPYELISVVVTKTM